MSKQELRLERAKYVRGLLYLERVKKLRERLKHSTYDLLMQDEQIYRDIIKRIDDELGLND